MCLLIDKPASAEFDYDDIADFYSKNEDGVGVMWAEDGVLYTQKVLPKNANEAWKFYLDYCQGRSCVMHWRMRTHGNIDLANCHPYEVFGDGAEMPLFLAHNGVLATGNAKDTTRSDTAHYIDDYLHVLLAADPYIIFHPAIIDLVEGHIGSGNKFILMNHLGQKAIVNEAAFVEYKGAQLSNTYAWTASKGGYGHKYGGYKGYGGYYGGYEAFDRDDWIFDAPTKGNVARLPAPKYEEATGEQIEDVVVGVDDEVDLFVDLFFDAMTQGKLSTAYRELSYVDAEAYYTAAGEDQAYRLVDDIINGYHDNASVLAEVNGTLLKAALAEQQAELDAKFAAQAVGQN